MIVQRFLAQFILSSVLATVALGQSVTFVPGHYTNVYFTEQTTAQIASDSLGNLYVPFSYPSIVDRINSGSTQPLIFAGSYFNNWAPAGDGGPATSAVLNWPTGVATDKAGNVYIADSWHNEVRKVDAVTGIITAVATVSQPTSLAIDASGNVYVTSSAQPTIIWKIPAGSASAVAFAGTGTSGYSGDGGPAAQATFGFASSVAINRNGDLYIADAIDNVVRRVNLTTGTISTAAGTGTAGYSGDGGPASQAKLNNPDQIAFDAAGDLYISDNLNNVIRRVSVFDQTISTIVGGGSLFGNGVASASGSALGVSMFRGGGLALDAGGNLWINGFYGVARVTASPEPALFEATLTGQTSQSRTYALMNNSSTPLLISAIQLSGANASEFEQETTCSALLPAGATCNISVRFRPLVAGTRTATVEIVDDGTGSPHQISLSGIGMGSAPGTFAFGPVPTSNSSTQMVTAQIPVSAGTNLSASLAFGNEFSISSSSCTSGSCSVAVTFSPKYPGSRSDAVLVKDANGNVVGTEFLTGVGQSARLVYHPGTQFGSAANEVGNPSIDYFIYGGAMDSGGNVYASDAVANSVFRWDGPNHLWIPVAGGGSNPFGGYSGDGGPATSAQLRSPLGLAFDPAGNLYICDMGNHSVRRVDRVSGTISTVAGIGVAGNSGDGGPATSATLNSPSELTIDSAGNLFISDRGSHVVRRVDSKTGFISTIAGTGVAGYTGDGTQATTAQLNAPRGLAIGLDGNLYIADSANNVVRMVNLSTGVISRVVGTGVQGSGGDGGPATSAQLNSPLYVLFDAAGSVYVSSGSVIREINPTRNEVNTLPSAYQSTGPLVMGGDGTLYVFNFDGFIAYSPGADPLTFPSTLVGSSAPSQSITVENTGAAAIGPGFASLTGSNIADFSESSTCPGGLAPGERCSITIGFQPHTTGPLTATLNASTRPLTLNGVGYVVPSSPDGTTLPPASQIVDSTGVVWTVSSGISYENGHTDGGANITLLLYYKSAIYARVTNGTWWSHSSGSWQPIAGDPRPASSGPSSTNGTTIPAASQIVDNTGIVWTVSSGISYENGHTDGGAGITLLLYYNSAIYAQVTNGSWWSHGSGSWQSIAGDPRPASSGSSSTDGTTIPAASQIIDNTGVVWTVNSGISYENGHADGGAGITLLLYYNRVIYAQVTNGSWWSHSSGTWQMIAGDPRPASSGPSSTHGTTIPAASQIVDNTGVVWTVSSGISYENGYADGGAGITLLLYYKSVIYAQVTNGSWWSHSSGTWQPIAGDPRS